MLNPESSRPVVEINYTLKWNGEQHGDITKCADSFVSKEEAIAFLNYVKRKIDEVIKDLET